jgi:hypothetical protein
VRKGKGKYKDNGRAIMNIHIVTGEKDGKFHLYRQTMIQLQRLPKDTRIRKGGTPG